MKSKTLSAQAYKRAFEHAKIAKEAVRKAIEENRQLGIPNVFYRNGRMYWEMPNGDITFDNPPLKTAQPTNQ